MEKPSQFRLGFVLTLCRISLRLQDFGDVPDETVQSEFRAVESWPTCRRLVSIGADFLVALSADRDRLTIGRRNVVRVLAEASVTRKASCGFHVTSHPEAHAES
jgi:hypothetical protein